MSDAAPPGINHDLILSYAAGASDFGQRQLLTLFDSLRRQEQQAAELSRAYLAQVCKLQAEVSSLRVGGQSTTAAATSTGPPIVRQKKPPQAPSLKAAPSSAAEVSLDDL